MFVCVTPGDYSRIMHPKEDSVDLAIWQKH
jgi:hypothetical protein